jgi:3-methyladenine DNA glycosylase AlkD
VAGTSLDRTEAFSPDGAARALTAALRSLGTPERATQEKRYLKSDLEFLGVTVPDMRRAVKAAARHYGEDLDRDAFVAWAVALWREPVHERRMAAVEVLTLAVRRLTTRDLGVVEQLIREAGTWALVDGLAVNVAGAIALRDGSAWPRIDGWASDGDFWVRRSALLALLPGIRAGQPELGRFTAYAEPLLTEQEFFIRKAAGWVLREISRRDPAWVARWTEEHISRMPGVTFREAVRRLPAEEAERLRRLRLRPPLWLAAHRPVVVRGARTLRDVAVRVPRHDRHHAGAHHVEAIEEHRGFGPVRAVNEMPDSSVAATAPPSIRATGSPRSRVRSSAASARIFSPDARAGSDPRQRRDPRLLRTGPETERRRYRIA